jgi:hypothetical protein
LLLRLRPFAMLPLRSAAGRSAWVDRSSPANVLTETSEQILTCHARLFAYCIERVASECALQVIGRDPLVGARTDPRLRRLAQAALLKFLYESAKTAANCGSGRSAAEEFA